MKLSGALDRLQCLLVEGGDQSGRERAEMAARIKASLAQQASKSRRPSNQEEHPLFPIFPGQSYKSTAHRTEGHTHTSKLISSFLQFEILVAMVMDTEGQIANQICLKDIAESFCGMCFSILICFSSTTKKISSAFPEQKKSHLLDHDQSLTWTTWYLHYSAH